MDTTTVPPIEPDTRVADVDQAHAGALAEQRAVDLGAAYIAMGDLIARRPDVAALISRDPMMAHFRTYDELVALARHAVAAGFSLSLMQTEHINLVWGPIEFAALSIGVSAAQVRAVIADVAQHTDCDEGRVRDPETAHAEALEINGQRIGLALLEQWQANPDRSAVEVMASIGRAMRGECPCGKGSNCGCGLVGAGEAAQAGTAATA